MGLPRSRRQLLASQDEEQEWIVRCQCGDASAFQSLVERYEERAYWVAYHLVGQAEDAQDVVQEAFIRVFRSIQSFRLGKRFYTWFYQIVLHLAIDHLRRRREHEALADARTQSLAAGTPEPGEAMDRHESVARVQEVLDGLPERDRAILTLRDIEGFSAKDIAEIVRSNHATVRWWLFLARKQFRREWVRRFGKEDPCAS